MNRISSTFNDLMSKKRCGFIGYLTAGDPNIAESEKIIEKAILNGLDILELGMPFSDPTADGPTIQAASQRSLASGTTTKKVFQLVKKIRSRFSVPIILFGYANPIFRYGYKKFAEDAASSGADGLLVVDLPFEEMGEIKQHLDRKGLALIQLISPTTPRERVKIVLKDAKGFVYYIMVTGVTGKRTTVAGDLKGQVSMLRKYTKLPIAAGFGVSNSSQVSLIKKYVDAIVVGSALVESADKGKVVPFVKSISRSLA